MIKPLGDRVVVEVAEVELKTKSGIIMPETSKEKPQKGKIVAVGTGKLLDNGTRAAMEVKSGDEVIFNKFTGSRGKSGSSDANAEYVGKLRVPLSGAGDRASLRGLFFMRTKFLRAPQPKN